MNIFKRFILPTLKATNIAQSEVEMKAVKMPADAALDATKKVAEASISIPIVVWPVKGRVQTSGYGWRELKYDGKLHKNKHEGIDICGATTEIIAPEDGVIKKVLGKDIAHPCLFEKKNGEWQKVTPPPGKQWGDGTWAWTPYIVFVGAFTKTMYIFRHCETPWPAGTGLKVGDKLGNYGNLGYSMGQHCHFETYPYSEALVKGTHWPTAVDPNAMMKKLNAKG